MKKTKKFKSKGLYCSCCGCLFRTWETYKDQDRDKGYGLCQPCQNEEVYREEKFIERQFNRILESDIKKTTRERMLKFSKIEQSNFIKDLLDKGILTGLI